MTVLHTTDHLVSTTLSSVKTRWCWHPQNTGKCSRRFCASAVYIFQKWRTEEGGGIWLVKLHPPPPKFRRPSKIVPNSTRLWKVLKIAEFRTPTSQDVRKKGRKILKLPPVHNCFTLARANELVVIINSLKIQKITKMLLFEIKFLVTTDSCFQNP